MITLFQKKIISEKGHEQNIEIWLFETNIE